MGTLPNDPIANFTYDVANEFGHVYQGMNYGLTKREYFAAMAMQGMMASLHTPIDGFAAQMSVEMADQLIKALNTK